MEENKERAVRMQEIKQRLDAGYTRAEDVKWLLDIIDSEPCPFCKCPGEQFDGHCCEDYAPTVRAEAARAQEWIAAVKPGAGHGKLTRLARDVLALVADLERVTRELKDSESALVEIREALRQRMFKANDNTTAENNTFSDGFFNGMMESLNVFDRIASDIKFIETEKDEKELSLTILSGEELGEVIHAIRAFIYVLPEGDDERGKARSLLISARDKLFSAQIVGALKDE